MLKKVSRMFLLFREKEKELSARKKTASVHEASRKRVLFSQRTNDILPPYSIYVPTLQPDVIDRRVHAQPYVPT